LELKNLNIHQKWHFKGCILHKKIEPPLTQGPQKKFCGRTLAMSDIDTTVDATH
jgi:hypothetical protein